MRKSLVVGILRESKDWERRTPLVPSDVNWLVNRGIKVEVESSHDRIFSDEEYKKDGAKIVDTVKKADLLLGIKEPREAELRRNKIYAVFSHTAKGQRRNMPLLRACLEKNITLIDYEKIADIHGKRLIYFGRFAGICGTVDGLCYLGKKLEWKGIKNPFTLLKPAHKYTSLNAIKRAMAKVDERIRKQGFPKELSPFIIGITGHGNVSKGVQEILEELAPVEIHPKDMTRFIRHEKGQKRSIYKMVFLREEKLRTKDGKGFYFEEYLRDPKKFRSNLDKYLPYINILVHTNYWDKRYPRMVTKKMVNKLSKKRPFRLEFISDIACDVNGSIELTYRTGSVEDPVFTYIPEERGFADGYKEKGITVLAIDNLPSELPRDSSREFGGLIREYVYQIAAHGVKDITNHAAIAAEVRRAVIAQGGKLIKKYRYLEESLM